MKYTLVYQWSALIGYASEIGYIERHYSNPRNFLSPQKFEYHVPKLKKSGKQYIFKTLKQAKLALEKEFTNEQ